MNIDIGSLLSGFTGTQWIVGAIVAFMFLTGKIKLSDLLNIFKPSPTPGPGPTPDPNPVNLIQILLSLLTKAKATNNKQLEDAVTTVLPHCCDHCVEASK